MLGEVARENERIARSRRKTRRRTQGSCSCCCRHCCASPRTNKEAGTQKKMKRGKEKKNCRSVQSCGAYSEHAQTHTGTVEDFFHIETPFKVDWSGPSADVENYCSDLTTTCTIKTAACGRGAGIFIPCGNKPYKHTDMQTELQTARNIFIHKHVRRARLAACFSIFWGTFFLLLFFCSRLSPAKT